MEMNEALEAVVKKMCETCGSGISGMDDWIDNQEACMLLDASPRKMLQLRRSRAIPYSYIDSKVYYLSLIHIFRWAGYRHPYWRRYADGTGKGRTTCRLTAGPYSSAYARMTVS